MSCYRKTGNPARYTSISVPSVKIGLYCCQMAEKLLIFPVNILIIEKLSLLLQTHPGRDTIYLNKLI